MCFFELFSQLEGFRQFDPVPPENSRTLISLILRV